MTATAHPRSTHGSTAPHGANGRAASAHRNGTSAQDLLSPADLEAFGAELDALRARVLDDLGQRDLDYIRGLLRSQRGLEVLGRVLLQFSLLPPAWFGGTAALSLSKILDNMEIGHNVMHGQYSWTGEADLQGDVFEWDTACPASQWRHSHNELHHTHTNVLGRDHDLGYRILRMADEQPWHPANLGNPLYATLLALLFQWGVALHDVELDEALRLEGGRVRASEKLREVGSKAGGQLLKDYVLFPALAGPGAPATLAGNATANLVRNVWAFTIIFCGHFPDGTHVFTPDEVAGETRGGWYLRQLLGSANLRGGTIFHILTGNLSHQIEHHLFPDLPAHRYPEMAVEVREICTRYGLPYNTGGLTAQFGSVVRRIVRLALPG